METKPQPDWKLRAGGVISVLYLVLFGMFEVYSAAATALDSHLAFPRWEPYLGWALFVLPCMLIAGVFLLHRGGSRSGFLLALMSLCLYMTFIVFDSFTHRGHAVSQQMVWEGTGIYVTMFLVALAAVYVLRAKNAAFLS
jgi:hypothetical protein